MGMLDGAANSANSRAGATSTRWMRGLDAAEQAGLHVKINAVALRGVNDMEFSDLIRFSHGRGMDLGAATEYKEQKNDLNRRRRCTFERDYGLPNWSGSCRRCRPGRSETPKRGGTLTYMIPADSPPSFDGHREETYATVHSAAPFYSVLIRVNPDNPASTTDFVCDLCTEMPKPTDDGKTYTSRSATASSSTTVAADRRRRRGELEQDRLSRPRA